MAMAAALLTLTVSSLAFAAACHAWGPSPWLAGQEPATLRTWGLRALLATILAQAGMFLAEQRLHPNGQVVLQMAATPARARALLVGWDEGQRAWMGFSLGLDLVYIECYSLLLAIGALYFARPDEKATTGRMVATAIFTAGFVDVIESFVLMEIVGNPRHFSEHLPFLGSLCAGIKFALLVLGITFVLVRAFRR